MPNQNLRKRRSQARIRTRYAPPDNGPINQGPLPITRVTRKRESSRFLGLETKKRELGCRFDALGRAHRSGARVPNEMEGKKSIVRVLNGSMGWSGRSYGI